MQPGSPPPQPPSAGESLPEAALRAVGVELLSHEGCPLVDDTRALLRECLAALGLTAPVIERVGAHPSPTVLIGGRDVIGGPGPSPGIAACRTDVPTRDRVLRALLTAQR